MGKLVKSILKVAAVAAISFFAPPLAAAIAPSIGLGTALGTTVLAAGIGAGAGELAGVGWQAGALAGGLSGGSQSGLFGGKPPGGVSASSASSASSTGAMKVSPFLNPQTPASLSGYPATAGAATSPFLNAATPASLAAPAGGAATTLGGALSKFVSNPVSALGSGVKNLTSGAGGATSAVGLGAGGLNLGGVAPTLIAAGLVGNPGGAMAKAQEAELMRAQQVNAALTQQRLSEANKLIGDAAYYDPEYMARQAAEAAMIKGGIETAKQTRGLTGERLAAERRRMRLDTARTAGTAYQQGYGTGVGARTETRKVGVAAIPTEYPMASATNAMAADQYARETKASEAKKLGDIFNTVLYGNPGAQLGA